MEMLFDIEPIAPAHQSQLPPAANKFHVAKLSFDGWHVGSGGFKGLHGYASFPLVENATHWMPLSGLGEPVA